MASREKGIQRGFTLLEVVVVLGIVGLFGVIIGTFQADLFTLGFGFQSDLNAQFQAQSLLRTTVGEIRSAGQADSGAYAIQTAEQTTFTFFSDIDGDGDRERVRYFLQDDSFMKGTIEPSGVPVIYDTDTETIALLIEDVQNTDLFTYYDSTYNGVGTTTALSFPVDVSDVRLVQIRLDIDRLPAQDPGPVTVTTQAAFRNLKDNL